jgi:hypothetical protein
MSLYNMYLKNGKGIAQQIVDPTLPAMDAPSDIPSSSQNGQMQVRWPNVPRRVLQRRVEPIPPKTNEEMMGAGMGTTAAKFPSESPTFKNSQTAPNTWNSKKRKTALKEAFDGTTRKVREIRDGHAYYAGYHDAMADDLRVHAPADPMIAHHENEAATRHREYGLVNRGVTKCRDSRSYDKGRESARRELSAAKDKRAQRIAGFLKYREGNMTKQNEALDEGYVPQHSRRKAAKDCGFYTRHMEHHKDTPQAEKFSRKAMRAALKAGLNVTSPGTHPNKHLAAAFKAGYDKAHAKLTGKPVHEMSPLDAREHIFGFIKESTDSTTIETNETQEQPMTITQILSDITSGKTTAQEAAATMANELVERGLKPRALQRFVAWGKEGNERHTRRSLPGGQNAEYQAANGTHLGESEEQEIDEAKKKAAKDSEDATGLKGNLDDLESLGHWPSLLAGKEHRDEKGKPHTVEVFKHDSDVTGLAHTDKEDYHHVVAGHPKTVKAMHEKYTKLGHPVSDIENVGEGRHAFAFSRVRNHTGMTQAQITAQTAKNKAKAAKGKKKNESIEVNPLQDYEEVSCEYLDEKGMTKHNTPDIGAVRGLVKKIHTCGKDTPEGCHAIKTLKDIHGVDFHALSKGN